jgi:CRP-like cAMP-binding protein
LKHEAIALIRFDEVAAILNRIAVFAALDDRQLHHVFSLLKTVSLSEGEPVYQAGDPPTHIYIIKSGEVRILLEVEAASLELLSLGVGDCSGETSVIGIQPHATTAVAFTPVELIVLERRALLDIFETDKELFGYLILNIARETARRLRKSEETIHQYLKSEITRPGGGANPSSSR